jgi:hypothetical protein
MMTEESWFDRRLEREICFFTEASWPPSGSTRRTTKLGIVAANEKQWLGVYREFLRRQTSKQKYIIY